MYNCLEVTDANSASSILMELLIFVVTCFEMWRHGRSVADALGARTIHSTLWKNGECDLVLHVTHEVIYLRQ